jgi:hypothetical protein
MSESHGDRVVSHLQDAVSPRRPIPQRHKRKFAAEGRSPSRTGLVNRETCG